MEQFAVYERAGQLHAVKAGFSWPAFFFSGIWALSKQMPGVGAGLLGALIGPLVLGEAGLVGEIGHVVGHFAPLAVGLAAGSFGNLWWATSLEDRNFERLGTIAAKSGEEAIAASRETETPAALDQPHSQLPQQLE